MRKRIMGVLIKSDIEMHVNGVEDFTHLSVQISKKKSPLGA